MQTRLGDGSIAVAGILAADAEYKTVGQKGSSLTKFSVKVGESGEGDDKKARWCNCTCWHQLARDTTHLRKGDSVFAIGKLETREYEKNGETKTSVELICEFVSAGMKSLGVLMDKGKTEKQVEQSGEFESIDTDDGDLPF